MLLQYRDENIAALLGGWTESPHLKEKWADYTETRSFAK